MNKKNVLLIKPSSKYLNSYLLACKETWNHVHDKYILHNPEKFNEWKLSIFENFKNYEKGLNLPQNFVPSSTFWLVENDEYIGTINIRHYLNENLAIYGGHAGLVIKKSKRNQGYGKIAANYILKKAKNLITTPLLLTCQESNTQSIAILHKLPYSKIEKEEIFLYNAKQFIRRYYFNT